MSQWSQTSSVVVVVMTLVVGRLIIVFISFESVHLRLGPVLIHFTDDDQEVRNPHLQFHKKYVFCWKLA